MAAAADIYQVASGQPIYGGRAAPSLGFDAASVTYTDLGGYPSTTQWSAKPFVFSLHGSGGQSWANGRQYRAPVSGYMTMGGTSPFNPNNRDYDNRQKCGWSVCIAYDSSYASLRVIDEYYNDAGTKKEAYHIGFVMPDGRLHLYEERRYDAEYYWMLGALPIKDKLRVPLTGGSMGGWGTISYGLRRYSMFSALFADRPRWNGAKATLSLPVWDGSDASYTKSNAPLLAPEDGGGSSWDYFDALTYISNPANLIRWIGFCLGSNDGFATMDEQRTIIAAMRATGRAFAFYWNDGNHTTGSRLDMITRSYAFDLFKIGVGWPCFSNFSRDQDPAVHKAGGINVDLTFDPARVTETATACSFWVTCVTPWSYAANTSTSVASTTSIVTFPPTECEIDSLYVGSTLTIGGETRTITAYDAGTAGGVKKATVDTPFSAVPALNASYTLTRRAQDAACTVDVAPVSEIYKGDKTPKRITIPSSNTWVQVQFP